MAAIHPLELPELLHGLLAFLRAAGRGAGAHDERGQATAHPGRPVLCRHSCGQLSRDSDSRHGSGEENVSRLTRRPRTTNISLVTVSDIARETASVLSGCHCCIACRSGVPVSWTAARTAGCRLRSLRICPRQHHFVTSECTVRQGRAVAAYMPGVPAHTHHLPPHRTAPTQPSHYRSRNSRPTRLSRMLRTEGPYGGPVCNISRISPCVAPCM